MEDIHSGSEGKQDSFHQVNEEFARNKTALAVGRYAAIDIGTVTCRLLVADIDAEGLHEIERGYGITNLGECVDVTGLLKPEAMQRVIDQITRFQEIISTHTDAEHPQVKVVAIATSASRDAKNSEEFLAQLAKLGIKPAIIPGEKEAALSFLGVANDFPCEDILVVDIGGGSTEFSAGYSSFAPSHSHSFDVGCRRVTDRFFHHDPPTADELAQARVWVQETIGGYFEALMVDRVKVHRMVAVAGTATSVVSIHKKMAVYDSTEVHRSIVSRQVLNDVYVDVRAMTLEQRKKLVGLDPERATVIVAGLLILDVAMELSGQNSFTASEADILQGVILDTSTK